MRKERNKKGICKTKEKNEIIIERKRKKEKKFARPLRHIRRVYVVGNYRL
jgi:hypothetical protein